MCIRSAVQSAVALLHVTAAWQHTAVGVSRCGHAPVSTTCTGPRRRRPRQLWWSVSCRKSGRVSMRSSASIPLLHRRHGRHTSHHRNEGWQPHRVFSNGRIDRACAWHAATYLERGSKWRRTRPRSPPPRRGYERSVPPSSSAGVSSDAASCWSWARSGSMGCTAVPRWRRRVRRRRRSVHAHVVSMHGRATRLISRDDCLLTVPCMCGVRRTPEVDRTMTWSPFCNTVTATSSCRMCKPSQILCPVPVS